MNYKQLLILRLSNLTEWLNEKEMIIPEEMRKDFNWATSCEFLGDGRCILRRYWENGRLFRKTEYQNGKRHGLDFCWHEDGQQWWETECKDGLKHGLSAWYYENGQQWEEAEYQNGLKHGLYLGWHKNGRLMWKQEYKNGKLIKRHL